MTSITLDVVNDFISLINDKWGSAGDAGQLPNVTKIWEKRTVGFIDDRKDQVIITPRGENINYFGLYGNDYLHEQILEVEIRTYQNDIRNFDITKEIIRIIKNNIRRDNYMDIRIIGSFNRNDSYRNMFAHVIRVSYRKVNP